MLTRKLAIAEYDWQRQLVLPDRLTRDKHSRYLGYARRMFAVYERGIGRMRCELHRQVHDILAREKFCPARRINAFCKLLDERAAFNADCCRDAVGLRREVFQMAAAYHPLIRQADIAHHCSERKIKQEIAARMGKTWHEIERDLFADVVDFQSLIKFHGYACPAALLARYNVAQVQVALYDAVQLTIWAAEDFLTIVRAIKLAGLMHTITRLADGRYRFVLSGPASVLRTTRRYGTEMAKFLPSLIACRGWKLHAKLRTCRNRLVFLQLSSDDGLSSEAVVADEFASQLEKEFAKRWGDVARSGWHLRREQAVLQQGQKVFVPDFELRHEDGRRVYFEIVGFWTPQYLEGKAATLRTFAGEPIIIAVPESRRHAIPEISTIAVVPFKSIPRTCEIIAAAESMA